MGKSQRIDSAHFGNLAGHDLRASQDVTETFSTPDDLATGFDESARGSQTQLSLGSIFLFESNGIDTPTQIASSNIHIVNRTQG